MKVLDPGGLDGVAGLVRCETHDREHMGELLTEMTHTVYPHDSVFGRFITVGEVIACPPEEVFAYLADPLSLMEWTYSVRKLAPSSKPGVLLGEDSAGTPFYCRTEVHPAAMTVDYLCAWDQGAELWMVYLNRVIPARTVLGREGSVVIWTNCHHPHYDRNPYPSLSDPQRTWVGELWHLFPAGHAIELANLKAILEHRQCRGLPLRPALREAP